MFGARKIYFELERSLSFTMQKIYTIAEIGQAHDGSLGIAHSFIDALAPTGVCAVKFQIHIAEAESSLYEPFRINFSYQDETRMDYWKRTSFDPAQWLELKKHCEVKNMDFIASPCSNKAVDLLESIGVNRIKIGSGEVSNFLMLERVAGTDSDIILSSGMSSISELDRAVEFLKARNCKLSILQCTSAYPSAPEQWGLNVISTLRAKYQVPTGFSDHSGDIFASLAAATLGAEILEFHVAFDKRMFGPDSTSSLTIDQVKTVVSGSSAITRSLQNPVNKELDSEFSLLKSMFGKSLSVNKNLNKGETLTFKDLEGKKPAGKGIPTKDFREIIGKKLKRDLKEWDFLNESDLS
jgi:N-acetylneuraminate synthase